MIFLLASCIDASNESINPISNSIELDFVNKIFEDSLNIFDYHYLYNGGGVGIIDVNNDGLKDLYLGGNMTSSKLLLNKGNFIFEDLTAAANLITNSWVNGISIIDINNDGLSDIYLSVGGHDCISNHCYNKLFVNQSNNDSIYFEEKSVEFGLQFDGYSQQGLFADFDNDGDLDLFQLQNFVDHKTKNYPKPKNYYSPKSIDKLFINLEQETGEIKFEERSKEWNVTLPGFGLGIALTDVNNDGYLDVYVANDFITDDIFYVNEGGEKFTDKSKEYLKHTSYNSMGVDIADINADELEDIVVVDMLPNQNARQKTMLSEMNFDKYQLSLKENYNSQFIRNTLQIHNGFNPEGIEIPFSEIGANLKIHETDWSWSPIILDYDNDTKADLFITNGYGKNITDLDFINYNSNSGGFGSTENAIENIKEQIRKLPSVDLANCLFLNVSDGNPQLITSSQKAISNGAAYADLDNDGDLDIVVNNLNKKSEIIINSSTNNSFKIDINGDDFNKDAIGSKVTLNLKNGKKMVRRISPVRSYMSSMDKSLIFGIGDNTILSMEIDWPNGEYSHMTLDGALDNITLDYKHISKIQRPQKSNKESNAFTQEMVLEINSKNRTDLEYDVQPLLTKPCLEEQPLMIKRGPEVFIANYKDEIVKFNTSDPGSTLTSIIKLNGFVVTDVKWAKPNDSDTNVIHFVATKQEKNGSALSKFFILDIVNSKIIKEWNLDAGIYKFDFINLDDDKDKEIILAHYPTSKDYPNSKGNSLSFYDQQGNSLSPTIPEFKNLCITSIETVDINGDKRNDIVVNGEWMSPKFLIQKEGGTEFQLYDQLYDYKGLWQQTLVEDIDGDGDKDLLLLNIGTNTRYNASKQNPLKIVSDDLDQNGRIDPILINFNESEKEYYTYHSRDDIAKVLPLIKNNYNSYEAFGNASADEIINGLKMDVNFKSAYTMESILLEQRENFHFEKVNLPKEVQYSFLNAAKFHDIDDDQDFDIILLTNNENIETNNGMLDALNTLVLQNIDSLKFESVPLKNSGIIIQEPTYGLIQADENSFFISSSKGIYKVLNK